MTCRAAWIGLRRRSRSRSARIFTWMRVAIWVSLGAACAGRNSNSTANGTGRSDWRRWGKREQRTTKRHQVTIDANNFRVVVHDEASHFLDCHLHGNVGVQAALGVVAGVARRQPAGPPMRINGGRGDVLHAAAELHDPIAARVLGPEQSAVRAAQHGIGRVAGLQFRDSKTGGNALPIQFL